MNDKVLMDNATIEGTTQILANLIQINKEDKDIVLLGVLNGAVPFLGSLLTKMSRCKVKLDTIKCKSYTGQFESTPVVISKKPDLDLSNCEVVIVEDIVDTGNTILTIKQFIKENYTNCTVVTCSLLVRENCPVEIEYPGYVVEEGKWVYGYGLDNDDYDRNLPVIMCKN